MGTHQRVGDGERKRKLTAGVGGGENEGAASPPACGGEGVGQPVGQKEVDGLGRVEPVRETGV
eukprot:scaffold27201_cov39-Isochrysis_galbana.AAC.1